MAISTRPLTISPSMVEPTFRAKRGESQSFAGPGPIQLTQRFATLKESLTSGRGQAISSSWQRLLHELPKEVDVVSTLGSRAIPIISFADTANSQQAECFLRDLRQRGVGIIRSVLPKDTALALSREARDYLDQYPQMRSSTTAGTQSQGVFWSPAQVKARAHPNVLVAQRFVMSIWKSATSGARVTTNFPVSYADRLGVPEAGGLTSSTCAHVDGGSVERWEPDGYGRAGTYKDIFQGRWKDYDPWESSTRLGVTSDLYHKAGACSIFRMFQGWLALSNIPSGAGSVQVCPLPRHATAYFLLRPFFSPPNRPAAPSTTATTEPAQEWALTRPQTSILHGALPSYAQEITPTLHPHLDLARSMVPVPDLQPGDYLVWHPDLIHSISPRLSSPSSNPNATTATRRPEHKPLYIYLPACPLTQTNALYLARQRKAFLLGHPAPDFGFSTGYGYRASSSGSNSSSSGGGGGWESDRPGRPGVQEVNDAGGDDGLRAMGLLPWDEEEADEDWERAVLAVGNGILFPDLYDML